MQKGFSMRGFITIATGKEHYYQLAYNMMRSYKYRGGKYPFAILCDRENRYTDAFDDVVLLDNTKNNYIDKFRILTDAPYEESFFIEPDCLMYKNVDNFFDMFEGKSDVSSFGYNNGSLDVFANADAIEEKYGFRTAPMFCPGYFYIKKGQKSRKVYNDAISVIEFINSNKNRFGNSFMGGGVMRDDPVFFISMKLNGCTCVPQNTGKCIHYPSFKRRNGHYPKMNFQNGYLEDDENNYTANLCHFSSKHTRLGKYKQQVVSMDLLIRKKFFLATIVESKIFLGVFCAIFHLKYWIEEKYKVMKRKH